MKERILRLCKRMDKFSIDEIISISEIEERELLPVLETLVNEKLLIFKNCIYFYNKKMKTSTLRQKQPLFFDFHENVLIDSLIKSFCLDIEVLKIIKLFNVSKHVSNKFYQYFRILIYENQYKKLIQHFYQKPKIPQERVYMNTKVYLYLYQGKLYVSKKYLESKEAIKHTEQERLEIKNIYLRSYRKVLSRSFEHKFHLHLAEEIWKYGKEYEEQYYLIKNACSLNLS